MDIIDNINFIENNYVIDLFIEIIRNLNLALIKEFSETFLDFLKNQFLPKIFKKFNEIEWYED